MIINTHTETKEYLHSHEGWGARYNYIITTSMRRAYFCTILILQQNLFVKMLLKIIN